MRVLLRRTVVPALEALRAYWGTTVLLVAACAAALAVMLPVAALVAPSGAGVAPTIALSPLRPADFGVVWGAFVQSPSEIRQAAVVTLVRLLLGVAIGVLAVTWFTTLSLSTARASGRAVEIAVRRAVGASRRHLLGAALLEGGSVATLALVVGGAAGVAAARLSLGGWPGTVGVASPVVGLAAVAATLSGIVLGSLFPLAFARRSARMAVVDPTSLGLIVPAIQLGVSLTVLVSASLLDRGAARLTTPTHAGEASGEVVEITARAGRPAARAARYAALLRHVHRDPGVEIASLTSPGALTGIGTVDITMTYCGACSWGGLGLPYHLFFAGYHVVSADSFRAMGLPLVAGRTFTDADGWGAAPVAIVSRSLAQRHFQPSGAVGRPIQVGHASTNWYTVVGVVEDQRPAGFGGGLEPSETVYLSVLQHPPTAVDLLVRGRLSAGALDGVAHALDDTLGPGARGAVRVSEAGMLGAEAAPLRWFGRMFGVEGWALLAVATVGMFAMMWLWVTSLLVELGARRAVGARRRDVMSYVLWRAVLVAIGGAAFGSWLGLMVWDTLGNVVAGLPAWDPGAVLRYGLLLGVAALAGALLPAWRAAHTPPAALLGAS
jgi:putative ABC transport system permease protein